MLALRTFGGFHLGEDGHPITVRSLKARLCLVFVRHHAGRHVARSELIEVLWGESSNAQARHSLSQTLYQLRLAIPSLQLDTTAEHVLIQPQSLHYDVEDLRHAARTGLFGIAAELYSGGFLSDLKRTPTSDLEHWIDSVARSTAAEALTAFRHLLKQAENTANWRDVEIWCDRILELEPFDEEAHAYRIRGTAALRGQEAATRLARDVRAQFASDAEGIHGQELKRTCERFADVDTFEVAIPNVHPEPTLRGRLNEFRTFTQAWARADSDVSQLVFITGVAGVGKTRLSTHFLKWAVIRGSRLLTTKASHPDTHMPYSVISHLLRSGLRSGDLGTLTEPWRSWLGRLLPEHSLKAVSESAPQLPGQREVFETVGQTLVPLADRAPLVLFIDDADLCDDLSAWILHFLFQRLNGAKLMIVLASRSPSEDLPAQLRLMIDSTEEARLARIQLGPIDDQSAIQLARDITDSARLDLSSMASADIVEHAKGIPFFIIESAASLVFHTQIAGHQGGAESGNYGVLSNVRMLPEMGTKVIQALAVLGFRAPATLVRSTSDCTPSDYAAAVAYLKSKRLVREMGRFLEFEHDIVREAVLADLPSAAARDLNHRAALTLASTTAAAPALLAMHYTAAGLYGHAYAAAMLAAAEARKVGSCSDVEFYLRLAISKATSVDERFMATAALIEHLCDVELFYEARRVLTSSPLGVAAHLQEATIQLLDLYRSLADTCISADEFIALLGSVWHESRGRQDSETTLRLLRGALGLAHNIGSPIVKDILHALVNQIQALEDSPEASKLVACLARTWAVYEGGGGALRLADQAIDIARRTGEGSALVLGYIGRGTVHMLSGRLREAEGDFTECEKLVQEPGLIGYSDRLVINRAVLLIETSRPAEAADSLERIVGSLSIADQLLTRGNLALAALELGDGDRLGRRIREMRSINATLRVQWADLFTQCMEGYRLLLNGKWGEARAIVRGLAEAEQSNREPFGSDSSYAETLIARWKSDLSPSAALQYLARVSVRHKRRNTLGELRLELERGRILLHSEPSVGEAELECLLARCRSLGASTLADHVLQSLHGSTPFLGG